VIPGIPLPPAQPTCLCPPKTYVALPLLSLLFPCFPLSSSSLPPTPPFPPLPPRVTCHLHGEGRRHRERRRGKDEVGRWGSEREGGIGSRWAQAQRLVGEVILGITLLDPWTHFHWVGYGGDYGNFPPQPFVLFSLFF
jgi:hypothetical protein